MSRMTIDNLTKNQVDESRILTIFVGLPSSGKTTFIKNLMLTLEYQGESVEVVNMKDYVEQLDDDYSQAYPDDGVDVPLMEYMERCTKVLNERKRKMLMKLMGHMENKVKNMFVDCNNLKRDEWYEYLLFASNLDYKIYFMFPQYGLLYYKHEFSNDTEAINHIKSSRKITMNEFYDYKSTYAFVMTNKDICGISPHSWQNII